MILQPELLLVDVHQSLNCPPFVPLFHHQHHLSLGSFFSVSSFLHYLFPHLKLPGSLKSMFHHHHCHPHRDHHHDPHQPDDQDHHRQEVRVATDGRRGGALGRCGQIGGKIYQICFLSATLYFVLATCRPVGAFCAAGSNEYNDRR